MRKLFLVLPILALTACSAATTQTGLAATGATLQAVGEQFVAVANVYAQGCDAGQIAPSQCAAFRNFGVKFKQSYPLAVALWESARKAGDAATEKQARDVITGLATDLSALAVQGLATFGGNH